MRVPKKYQDRVSSLERLSEDEFDTARYEINLRDGWSCDGDCLIYAETYQEALEVMREATRDEEA